MLAAAAGWAMATWEAVSVGVSASVAAAARGRRVRKLEVPSLVSHVGPDRQR